MAPQPLTRLLRAVRWMGRRGLSRIGKTEGFVACSSCFRNEGLRLDAARLGSTHSSRCPRCGTTSGQKLTSDHLSTLAQHFFVWGSVRRFDYGAAPAIQFNDRRETDIVLPGELDEDARVFEEVLRVGFFAYGPRFWMFGEVEPLKRLRDETSRSREIEKILREYGTTTLAEDDRFYRVRKNPRVPSDVSEYDSPPTRVSDGRLDAHTGSVMYASRDLDTCLHECRVSVEDDLFVATLRPRRALKLLDVSRLLHEPQEVSEFESLDLAVNMLFLAGEHSYAVTRAISRAVQRAGFDGMAYPSYFSMLRNGVKPFETTYGISHRRIPQYREFEDSKISPNYAIFGRPVEARLVDVQCVNRVVLSTVVYSVHFGPVLDQASSWRTPSTDGRGPSH